MSKFTHDEKSSIQNMVANLTIKRIPDAMIIKHVENTTGKSITRKTLWNIRQRLKKESYDWYSKLRKGEYEYLYEFKERINEIVDLQRRHYKIIDYNVNNPSIQQASLAALHKLNVTLSNYYDVVPYLTVTGQRQTQEQTETETQRNSGIRMDVTGNYTKMPLIDNCQCRLNGGDTIRHNECRYCLHIWCPKAIGQDWCPNTQCTTGIAGCKFQPYDENYTWIKCSCGMSLKTQEILDAHLAAYSHNDNVNQ